MGASKFHAWMLERFDFATETRGETLFADHVVLDMTKICQSAARRCKNPRDAVKRVLGRVESLFAAPRVASAHSVVRARRTVAALLEGPAPAAKLAAKDAPAPATHPRTRMAVDVSNPTSVVGGAPMPSRARSRTARAVVQRMARRGPASPPAARRARVRCRPHPAHRRCMLHSKPPRCGGARPRAPPPLPERVSAAGGDPAAGVARGATPHASPRRAPACITPPRHSARRSAALPAALACALARPPGTLPAVCSGRDRAQVFIPRPTAYQRHPAPTRAAHACSPCSHLPASPCVKSPAQDGGRSCVELNVLSAELCALFEVPETIRFMAVLDGRRRVLHP